MTTAPPRIARPSRWTLVAESAAIAAGAYVAAGILELTLIHVFQPTELELTWVSDMLLAAAFGAAVYFWRHLRLTRLDLAAQERSQLVLDTQLAVAADMQRRLLPSLPPACDGLEWAADLRPAGRIGGDFYDLVPAGPGRTLALVADVSGKGVPAAMALSTVRAAFRSIVAECRDPGPVLTALSSTLYEQWGGEPYLTAIVVSVDVTRRVIRFANAGHPAGVVAGAGEPRLLPALGPPAALLPDVGYAEQAVAIGPGDVGVLVSDGVTEGLGDGGHVVLHDMVRRIAMNGPSARAACTLVMNEARSGRGPRGLEDWQDDLTVVAFTVTAQDATTIGRDESAR